LITNKQIKNFFFEKFFGYKVAPGNLAFMLGLIKKLWGALKAPVFQPVEREIILLCYADVFRNLLKDVSLQSSNLYIILRVRPAGWQNGFAVFVVMGGGDRQ
jgi:hypothetical protein